VGEDVECDRLLGCRGSERNLKGRLDGLGLAFGPCLQADGTSVQKEKRARERQTLAAQEAVFLDISVTKYR